MKKGSIALSTPEKEMLEINYFYRKKGINKGDKYKGSPASAI